LKPSFSRGTGAVLPTKDGVTHVRVDCARGGKVKKGSCTGSVSLVPRGQTADKLGSHPIASKGFFLRAHHGVTLVLRLNQGARGALAQGPLLVTAILRKTGLSERPVAQRPAAIVRPQAFKAPPQAPHARHVPGSRGSNNIEYSWDWTIPAHHYMVLNDFKCPNSAPRVAWDGRQVGFISSYKAKVEVTAGDGVGYSGWDHVDTTASTFNVDAPYNSKVKMTNMIGWPEGGLFYNSIWAPVFSDGSFSLKVTCTNAAPENSARVHADSGGKHYENFLPWYFDRNPR
jgi:hypothetical protein